MDVKAVLVLISLWPTMQHFLWNKYHFSSKLHSNEKYKIWQEINKCDQKLKQL
uniref:Uncharacterized protein n=1 Tax=Octopus bimaculoides TaxID=37653 RepID=A0A0L8IBZ3_OCTBM